MPPEPLDVAPSSNARSPSITDSPAPSPPRRTPFVRVPPVNLAKFLLVPRSPQTQLAQPRATNDTDVDPAHSPCSRPAAATATSTPPRATRERRRSRCAARRRGSSCAHRPSDGGSECARCQRRQPSKPASTRLPRTRRDDVRTLPSSVSSSSLKTPRGWRWEDGDDVVLGERYQRRERRGGERSPALDVVAASRSLVTLTRAATFGAGRAVCGCGAGRGRGPGSLVRGRGLDGRR